MTRLGIMQGHNSNQTPFWITAGDTNYFMEGHSFNTFEFVNTKLKKSLPLICVKCHITTNPWDHGSAHVIQARIYLVMQIRDFESVCQSWRINQSLTHTIHLNIDVDHWCTAPHNNVWHCRLRNEEQTKINKTERFKE